MPPLAWPAAARSRPDVAQAIGLLGIFAERLLRDEMQVALDDEAQRPLDARKFAQPHAAQFREAHAEVAQAEGDVRENTPLIVASFCLFLSF